MKNPIFDIENWREIGATLARNKTRTFLTAFGIFWGTAMLAMLWGGAGGLKGLLMRNLNGFDTNMGVIFPGRTTISYKGFNKGMRWDMTEGDLANIRRLAKGIKASSGVRNSGGTVAYGTKQKSSNVTGVEPDYFKIMTPVIFSGRLINESDTHSLRKVALIGRNLANELFGTEDPLGKYINVRGVYFQVVGVIGQMSEASIGTRLDDSVILPNTTMIRAFNLGNSVGFFTFTVNDGLDPADVLPAIKRAVRISHPIHPDDTPAIGMMNLAEQFRMVNNVFLGVSILSLFVGAGTLIAGIIGVGNIMWIIVKERTQEIGIRRAIGAKPRDIIMQVLSESIVLTVIAGIAGICFASGILAIAEMITPPINEEPLPFQLTFYSAIIILVVFLTLGTAAGTIPAIKAMRIKPIEALNDK